MKSILVFSFVFNILPQTAWADPTIAVRPVKFLLMRAGAFVRNAEGQYFEKKGLPHPVFTRPHGKDENGERKQAKQNIPAYVPPEFTILNEEREFVYDITRELPIPLNAPVNAEHHFAAVIYLLAKTPTGRETLLSLMDVETLSSAAKGPYEVIGGERGVKFSAQNNIDGDWRIEGPLRKQTSISLVERPKPDGKKDETVLKIHYRTGEQVGILAAELIFALNTDLCAGLDTARYANFASSKNENPDYDFDCRRTKLFNHFKPRILDGSLSDIIGLVPNITEGLVAISRSEHVYRQKKLSGILANAHQSVHQFYRELLELPDGQNAFLYYTELEQSGVLGGVALPLREPDLHTAYRLAPEAYEPYTGLEERRCQEWILSIRPNAVF